MMKFFRKYNKELLAVFMCLLMIVFIGGSALESFLAPSYDKTVIATSQLGPISLADQQRAGANTQFLSGGLGFNWRQPVGGLGDPLEETDWILLSREAAQIGLYEGTASARAWLGEGSEDTLNTIALRFRARPKMILEAIAEMRAIQRTAQLFADSQVPGASELRSIARQVLDKVVVNSVVLPAKAFVDESLTFTTQQIQAQWEPYKDLRRGPGLSFGYYLPVRIWFQFIRIDRNKIAELIGVPNLEKKARKYYDEQRNEFRRPPGSPPPDDSPESAIYLTWEEARPVAEVTMRGRYADEAASRIADWLLQFTSEPFLDVPRGDDGYKSAPESVAREAYYEEVIQRIPPSINFPDAVIVGETGGVTIEEAVKLPFLGHAVYRPKSGFVETFTEIAFRNKVVVPKLGEEVAADSSKYVNMHQTYPQPLVDPEGNYFIFRAFHSGDDRPSLSAAEVRNQVIADLRLLDGLQSAKARAEGLRSCDPSLGLKEAYESDAELMDRVTAPEAGGGFFTSFPVSLQSLGLAGSSDKQDSIYAGPGLDLVPRSITKTWFSLEHADDRIIVQQLDHVPAVLVVEWVNTEHPTHEEFAGIRDQLVRQVSNRRTQEAMEAWLSPSNIRARTGFKLAR